MPALSAAGLPSEAGVDNRRMKSDDAPRLPPLALCAVHPSRGVCTGATDATGLLVAAAAAACPHCVSALARLCICCIG